MVPQLYFISDWSCFQYGSCSFLSRSGSNPIMVQPLQSGASLCPASLANVVGLSGGPSSLRMVLRNIDIRIHSGLSANHSGQDISNQAIPSRPSGTSTGQISNGLTGKTTTRILSLQTMVTALPASGSRMSDTATGGSGVGFFYPLLARFQHLPSNVSLNEKNNNVPNNGESKTRIGDGSFFGNVSLVFTSWSFASPNQ